MIILNYTPNDLILYKDKTKECLKSQGIARCSEANLLIDSINGYYVYSIDYGAIIGLPPALNGTCYIVLPVVAEALKNIRSDLLVVNEEVRDENGKIIGCHSFAKI